VRPPGIGVEIDLGSASIFGSRFATFGDVPDPGAGQGRFELNHRSDGDLGSAVQIRAKPW